MILPIFSCIYVDAFGFNSRREGELIRQHCLGARSFFFSYKHIVFLLYYVLFVNWRIKYEDDNILTQELTCSAICMPRCLQMNGLNLRWACVDSHIKSVMLVNIFSFTIIPKWESLCPLKITYSKSVLQMTGKHTTPYIIHDIVFILGTTDSLTRGYLFIMTLYDLGSHYIFPIKYIDDTSIHHKSRNMALRLFLFIATACIVTTRSDGLETCQPFLSSLVFYMDNEHDQLVSLGFHSSVFTKFSIS
jgi:hypothetical protein